MHEVAIDGLAVLKIVKHCKDALPNLYIGALLGLDQHGVLEVTHSFPAAEEREERDDYSDQTSEKYQMEMMTSLREVNVDNNIVGWYQSMLLGTFNLLKLIQNLSSYHESIPNSVVILYDPVQTANGSLTIRAFRLSGDYRALAARAMNEYIEPSRIFEELPLKVSPRFPPFPLLREPFSRI